MPTRLTCALVFALVLGHRAQAASPVGYQRDVQPIFAEHCAQCHGVDKTERKGGLRLDRRESVLKGGNSGQPAIVPGAPDESEIISRITSDDPAERMPPAKLG
jgi:mono/diheme cytochrome c family protein